MVQTDAANTNPRYPNTIVATLATKGRTVATHVEIEPTSGNGLRAISYAKCEQVLTISNDRLETKWGTLDLSKMEEVDDALRAALSL